MHFSRPLLRSTAGAALVVAGAAWLDAPAWAFSSPSSASSSTSSPLPARATVLSAIGNTPLVELESLTRLMGGRARIFAKLESQNPGGSIKDRAALWLIEDAEKRGALQPGDTIVEGTGGNTGIGLVSSRSHLKAAQPSFGALGQCPLRCLRPTYPSSRASLTQPSSSSDLHPPLPLTPPLPPTRRSSPMPRGTQHASRCRLRSRRRRST